MGVGKIIGKAIKGTAKVTAKGLNNLDGAVSKAIVNAPKKLWNGADHVVNAVDNDIRRVSNAAKNSTGTVGKIVDSVLEDVPVEDFSDWATPRGIVGKQLKTSLRAPAAVGLPVAIMGVGAAVGDKQINNKLKLGTIGADPEGLPNQVTQTRSPALMKNTKYVPQTKLDTLGADGELAMALHYLRRR